MKKSGGSKKSTYISVFFILLAAAVLITWQISYYYLTKTFNDKYTKIFSEITTENDISHIVYNTDGIIRSKYIGSIDDENLLDNTLEGYLDGIGDRYASYMNEKEYEEYLLESSEKARTGIGVSVIYDKKENGLYVIGVNEKGPAYEAGIVPGDVITEIDGSKVVDLGQHLAENKITGGDIGSEVKLKVENAYRAAREVSVMRDELKKEKITGKMLENLIGLVTVKEFTQNSTDEFKNVIKELSESGAEKFIIDIRNNPGGDIDGITQLLDFLLPEGETVIFINKNGKQKTYTSDPVFFNAPMALLVNKNTAGTAELFAASVKEFGKATVVGSKTYGKGSVQEVIELPEGGANISTGVYLPPSEVSFDGSGITPEYEVELPEMYLRNYFSMTDDKDTQLQKAIEVLDSIDSDVEY